MRSIYLDHAATTPLRQEAYEAMIPYLTESFGNPSSIHAFGRKVRKDLEDARERVANALKFNPGKYFLPGEGRKQTI